MYLFFVLFACLSLPLPCFLCLSEHDKLNIVIIIADDLGWNDLSFHGSDQIATPNIDALGYHGVFFNRFYAQPSCTPSRAALLTGKYPIRVGYQGYPLGVGMPKSIPHDVETLPRNLQRLGYKTHLVGKWHLGHSRKIDTPLGYGYDTHFGYWNGYIGYFHHDIGEALNGTDLHDQLQPVMNKDCEYATDLFTERAVKIINEHPKHKPLHLVVSHLAGHTGKSVSESVKTVLEVHNETETNEKYAFIEDPERRKLAEIVENMDKSVGEVIEALANKDLLRNSVIVFFSDNGAPTFDLHANYGSNYPLRGIKQTMYEGAVRVPALVFSPLIKHKGRVFDGLFHMSDWAPTLLKAAGGNVKSLGKIDGINQWESIKNPFNNHMIKRHELLVELDPKFDCGALIGYDGRYKLINNSYFLYNYSGDPGFTQPQLNYLKVKQSKTNFYLETMLYEKLTQTRMDNMRSQTKINCLPNSSEEQETHRQHIQPCTGVCLYDLWNDPCEYEDIADQHPDIVENLFRKLETLQLEAKPKLPTIVDPKSDPNLCNHTWFNWLDKDGCWFDRYQSDKHFDLYSI